MSRDADVVEMARELRRDGCPSVPVLMIAGLACDPHLSFASMGDCMAVGIAGGCGLRCPVLHAGRCDTQEDFRDDATDVLALLRAQQEGRG